MTKPPVDLNPRRLPDRTRPLAEKVREGISAEPTGPAELARTLGEPISVVAFHWLRDGRPGASSEGAA